MAEVFLEIRASLHPLEHSSSGCSFFWSFGHAEILRSTPLVDTVFMEVLPLEHSSHGYRFYGASDKYTSLIYEASFKPKTPSEESSLNLEAMKPCSWSSAAWYSS